MPGGWVAETEASTLLQVVHLERERAGLCPLVPGIDHQAQPNAVTDEPAASGPERTTEKPKTVR